MQGARQPWTGSSPSFIQAFSGGQSLGPREQRQGGETRLGILRAGRAGKEGVDSRHCPEESRLNAGARDGGVGVRTAPGCSMEDTRCDGRCGRGKVVHVCGPVCTRGDASARGRPGAAARSPGAQRGDRTGFSGQAFTVASCLQQIDSCSFPKKPNRCWGKSVLVCKNIASSCIEK